MPPKGKEMIPPHTHMQYFNPMTANSCQHSLGTHPPGNHCGILYSYWNESPM